MYTIYTNTHIFEIAMNIKDELDLITKYQETGCLLSRNKLIEYHLKLVYSIANKMSSSLHPVEDLIQEGVLGLIRCLSTFDKTKGTRLSTLIGPSVKGTILSFLKKDTLVINKTLHSKKPNTNAVTSFNPDFSEMENLINEKYGTVNFVDNLIREELISKMYDFLLHINYRDRERFLYVYVYNVSQSELITKFSCSHQNVRQSAANVLKSFISYLNSTEKVVNYNRSKRSIGYKK